MEKGVSHIAYFRLDGGSSKLYTQEYVDEKDKEIERLKQGYCELKEKCNKGECDCTHEEYNNMCEENIKMDLEIERLNNIINELEELCRNKYYEKNTTDIDSIAIAGNLYVYMYKKIKELKGDDKE